MSSFTDILGDRVKVTRRGSFLVEQAAVTANPTIGRQPARSVLLRVFVDTPVGGTVQLAGNSVEAVTFIAGDRKKKQTSQFFTSLAALTIQGLTGGTVSVEAITQTGEPVLTEKVVTASLACKWYVLSQNRIRLTRTEAGQQAVGEFRFQAEWNADVLNGDIIQPVSGAVAGLTLGHVTGVYKVGQFDGTTHHLEVDVRRM